jgi:hypothetical protein
MHAPMWCFQNALANFVTTVNYTHKMFAKSAPDHRPSQLVRHRIGEEAGGQAHVAAEVTLHSLESLRIINDRHAQLEAVAREY